MIIIGWKDKTHLRNYSVIQDTKRGALHPLYLLFIMKLFLLIILSNLVVVFRYQRQLVHSFKSPANKNVCTISTTRPES